MSGDFFDRPGFDVGAVPHDHDTIGDLKNLFDPVADVDDSETLILELPDDLQQAVYFVGGQGRRRFVHHDDACVERQRFRNLNDVLLRDREGAAGDVFRYVDTDSLDQLEGAVALMATPYEAAHGGFAS